MNAARRAVGAALSLALLVGFSPAYAQLKPPQVPGLRGAPFPSGNPPPDLESFGEGPAWDAKPPTGVEPLPRDLFTSKDFYQDREQWLNPRYWRCNSPRQIADMRSGGAGAGTSDPRIGANPPRSARWGDCSKDWPRRTSSARTRSRRPRSITRRSKPTRRSAAGRRTTPTRRCRNGTASTASTCRTAGASGTTAARRRCRRSSRSSRPNTSSAWCGSSTTRASTPRTNGRPRTAGPKGSCGNGPRARSRSASS